MRAPWRSRPSPIGIEINGRFINAVQLRGGSRPRIEACVMIRRSDPDVPIDPAEIRLLASVLDRKGFQGTRVVLTVPPDQLTSDVLELPADKEGRHAERSVRAELTKRHDWAEEGFEVASWDLPQARHREQSRRVLAVACSHHASGQFLDAFEQAGLQVCSLDLQAWAITRLCAPMLNETAGLCGVVSLGWSSANLIVMNRDVVVFVRMLNDVALNRLHLSLCSSLDLDDEVCEHVIQKVGLVGSTPQAETPGLQLAQRQITSFAGKLVAELRRSLSYVLQEFPDTPVERLLLVGEGAGIRGLDTMVGEGLALPTTPLVPTSVIDCTPSLSEQCGEPMLTTAVGLATW